MVDEVSTISSDNTFYYSDPVTPTSSPIVYEGTHLGKYVARKNPTDPGKEYEIGAYLSQETINSLAHKRSEHNGMAKKVFELLGRDLPEYGFPGGRMAFQKSDGSIGFSGLVLKRSPPFPQKGFDWSKFNPKNWIRKS